MVAARKAPPSEVRRYLDRQAAKYGLDGFDNDCAFCQYYLNWSGVTECERCPLYEPGMKGGKTSNYDPAFSYPCSRAYWHWDYWDGHRGDGPEAVAEADKWAKRVLKELRRTPEEEVAR